MGDICFQMASLASIELVNDKERNKIKAVFSEGPQGLCRASSSPGQPTPVILQQFSQVAKRTVVQPVL